MDYVTFLFHPTVSFYGYDWYPASWGTIFFTSVLLEKWHLYLYTCFFADLCLDKACFQVIPAFLLMLLSQRNHNFLSESRFGGRCHVAQLVESQLHNQGLLNLGHGSENTKS